MTQIRQSSKVRKIKDITVGSAVFFTILGGVVSMQSCVSSQSLFNEQDNSNASLEAGIQSYIKEETSGRFKIFDERKIALDSTTAIIEWLDGQQDTLTLEDAKALIDDFIENHEYEIGRNNSLENTLLFGGIGHILAKKDVKSEYSFYRDKFKNQDFIAENDSTENYWNQPFMLDAMNNFGYYFYNRFYFTPTIYKRCRTLHHDILGPRYAFTRPTHSSSGHFTYHHSYSSFGG